MTSLEARKLTDSFTPNSYDEAELTHVLDIIKENASNGKSFIRYNTYSKHIIDSLTQLGYEVNQQSFQDIIIVCW